MSGLITVWNTFTEWAVSHTCSIVAGTKSDHVHWGLCNIVSILGYTRAIERDTIIVNKLYSQFNSSDYTGVGVRAFVYTREQSVWSDCTCARVSVDTDTTFSSYKQQVCPLTILVCRLKVTCLLYTDDTAKASINMITLCTCNNSCRFVKLTSQ